jgi:hypothetical protein
VPLAAATPTPTNGSDPLGGGLLRLAYPYGATLALANDAAAQGTQVCTMHADRHVPTTHTSAAAAKTPTHALSNTPHTNSQQPFLLSGLLTHPARAVLAAAWDGASSGGGRLMVVGSSEVWADAWLEQRAGAEGNARWAEAAVAVRALGLGLGLFFKLMSDGSIGSYDPPLRPKFVLHRALYLLFLPDATSGSGGSCKG